MPSSDGMLVATDKKNLRAALDVLGQRGWFAGLRPGTQTALAEVAKLRPVLAGDAVYRAGDAATGLFGLACGGMDVTVPRDDGFDAPVIRLEPGAWFGASSVLSSEPRNMSVTAAMDSLLVFVPKRAVQVMVQADAVVFQELFALIHGSFTLTLRLLANSLILDSCKQIGLRLLIQYEQAGDPADGVALSQSDLAAFCGVSVATVERAIKKLAADGIVQTSYSRLYIRNRDALLAYCAA